jgi:large subunit ribosomal protein L27Ae
MRTFHLRRNIHYRPTINLDKIWTLVPKNVLVEAQNKKDQSLCIDVTKYGYHKVCGKGILPDVPLVVKAKFISRKAEHKIKAVGGACVLTA